MTDNLKCESIKRDLEYLHGILDKQEKRNPTPDVKRFETQVQYRKILCKLEREEKAE
ncbi:MAG: hypothetical protein AB3K77_11240 [Methanosarcinaceae archaeon]